MAARSWHKQTERSGSKRGGQQSRKCASCGARKSALALYRVADGRYVCKSNLSAAVLFSGSEGVTK